MAALARSALRYSARHEAAASDSFADHVIAGLSDSPKWLSAKYFYDAAGSALFEEITRLPEYYPTRTELSILERMRARYRGLHSAVRRAGRVRHRLDQEGAHPDRCRAAACRLCAGRYLGEFLAQEAAAVRRDIPWIAVLPVAADFTRDFDLPPQIRARPRVGFFPGSTIGNFEPEDAAEFLRQAGRVLGQGATMIVGVDLIKDDGGAQRRLRRCRGRDGAVQSQYPARA